MAQTALLLMLEFARTEQGGDPFGFRFDTQEYLVRSEGGAFKSARFSWDSQLLEDLERLRLPGRDPSLIQRIGQMLRRFLEPTKWTQDEVRILDAVKEGRRVMVSIRSAAAELYALPWELLVVESTGQHVGELPGVLLRYEWPDTRSIPASGPHYSEERILVAWSAAAAAVPASAHIAAILKANPRDYSVFDETRDVLAHVSCGRLSSALSAATLEGHPVAILHVLAHGSVAGDTFGIALDGDEPHDSVVVVDAGRLRQLLAPHASTLRLVVLAACDTGNSGVLGNQLGSVAQALHRAGIAAVVASRYPLSVSGAMRLVDSLYAALLAGGCSLEHAILCARLRLAEDAAQLDWASLQFYARAADGVDTRPIAIAGTLSGRSEPQANESQPSEPHHRIWLWIAVVLAGLLILGAAGAARSIDRASATDNVIVPRPPVAPPNVAVEPARPPPAAGRIAVEHKGDIHAKGSVNITAPPGAQETSVRTIGQIEAGGDVNMGVTAPAVPLSAPRGKEVGK